MQVSIQIKDEKINKMFTNYNNRIEAVVVKANQKVANNYVNELKKELILQGLIDTGELFNSIGAVKSKRREYIVKMKRYGIALDRMRPHWVSLLPGRRITSWYERNFPESTGISREIFVRPHPWIKAPLSRANRKVKRIFQRDIHNFIESKGRL